MPHYKTMLGKPALGEWSLIDPNTGKPRELTLEIERVVKGLVKSKDKPDGDDCPLIYFKGAKKPMVCNSTNGKTIEDMVGPMTEKWIGLKVTLYRTTTMAFGKKVNCIRIKPMKATGPAQELTEPTGPAEVIEHDEAPEEAAGREPGEDG